MNYYQHHIGDFNQSTRHLTRLERSIYRDLMDLYYDKENAIPTDVERSFKLVLAHTEEEQAAVRLVLAEFFDLQPDGYHQHRCDREIERFYAKSEQARNAGLASAERRANKKTTPVESPLNGSATTHNPLPITHDPLIAGKPAKRKCQLPDDFYPDQTGIGKAAEAGIQLANELERFRDHHKGKGNAMLDWQAAWRMWVSNAVKFAKRTTPTRADEMKKAVAQWTGKNQSTERVIDGESKRIG